MNLRFKPLNVPLMIINDAPDHLTGLARIGRDLASLIATLPQFRVAYLGLDGVGRKQFPWCSYSFPSHAGFGEHHVMEAWHDFAGEDHGIIMSLWDASRMLWFGQGETCQNPALRKFLGPGRTFQKWGYFPVDGTGPDEQRLGIGMRTAVAGYDRVLAASEWGRGVLQVGGRTDADWIPHGLWMDKWQPIKPDIRDYTPKLLGWQRDQVHVGCNMSNQSRKDWPVAFETAAILRHHYGNRFHFWAHTDTPIRYWNLYALAEDFGVSDCMELTQDLTDAQLALRYSACDCTILPSGGEGFGFPIAESMACGTACIVTDYAAGQEIADEYCRVRPVTFRIDTTHNVQRAVLSGHGFAAAAQVQIEKKREDWEGRGEELRDKVMHLDWPSLKTVWTRWLLDGLRAGQ